MTAIFSKPTRSKTRLFWQGCWSARSVEAVEVNGYTIEPGANLARADLSGVLLGGADLTAANLKGMYLEGCPVS